MKQFTVLGNTEREFKPTCTVKLENKVDVFNDFVTVGYCLKKQKITLIHNADILTLSLALEIITKAFQDMYVMLPPNEKEVIDNFIAKGDDNGY